MAEWLQSDWLRVGLGPDASRWTSRSRSRRVLFVVHNVTSATRLMDVIPLFGGDLRVSGFITCTGSSPFQAGLSTLFNGLELPLVPWEQAKSEKFDLIISASYGGNIQELHGKLVILPHGMGYNKILSREAGKPGSREAGKPGSREAGKPGSREAFGLAAEWLLHDGRPIADHSVLSHPEQLARLQRACPQAVPTAVLCGDPCFDRLLDAVPYRERYRAALGVDSGHRFIVVNSTWNPGSLFGDDNDVLPLLLERIASELPLDDYRVAAVLHPNIWYGHGPGQIRSWLARAERAGMLLVPPLDGWRQTLIAADTVIGDHGSVSYYAAAIGVPVVLGAFPDSELDPDSPVARFGHAADRLDHDAPLRPQLDAAIDEHRPERFAQFAEWASSDPGRAAQLLRSLFYRVLEIDEPLFPAQFDGLAPPELAFTPPACAVRVLVTSTLDAADAARRGVRVVRYPEYTDPPGRSEADHAHLAVREDSVDFAGLRRADLVLAYARPGRSGDPAGNGGADLLARLAREHPHSSMVADCSVRGQAVVRYRDGRVFTLECSSCPCDPAPLASMLLARLDRGDPAPHEAAHVPVFAGGVTHAIQVTPRN